MVEQAAGCFSGVDIQLTFDGRLGEDVGGVPLIQYIISDMLDNCSCLLVVNQGGSTNDKLFGIVFELIKSDLFNASQNSNYGFSGQTCFFHELSDKIISDNKLTALMITHNMTDAIRHGNRLIMMDRGKIVLDISGEEKSRLTKADLLERFAEKAGVQEETDSVLLS